MDQEKRKALEAAGFQVGDAGDFLGLTEAERRIVELRAAASQAVRRRRKKLHLTQQQLATKIKSSQSRVAKIESGDAGVSLDLVFRALFELGGSPSDLCNKPHGARARRSAKAKTSRHVATA